jgi:hypothetical protein
MLRFCADENLNNNILRGLLRHLPELDIVRIQDVGLSGIKVKFKLWGKRINKTRIFQICPSWKSSLKMITRLWDCPALFYFSSPG